jgi:hypothetical protein
MTSLLFIGGLGGPLPGAFLLGDAEPLADLAQAQAFSAEFANLLAAFHVG